jgi:hypothetical protein
MPNLRWWIARWLMRLRGDQGCKGDGYTLDAQRLPVPCMKHGCH